MQVVVWRGPGLGGIMCVFGGVIVGTGSIGGPRRRGMVETHSETEVVAS
jgi:hypothetical protein